MKCWSHKWGVLGVWLLIKYTAVPTLESLRHGFRYNLGSLTWSCWPNGCQPRCWARQLTAAFDFCTPRLLLITAECLLAESSAFQLQPHIQGAKHTKETVVLLNPQLAMTSSQSRIMSNCLKVSTVTIKTKHTFLHTEGLTVSLKIFVPLVLAWIITKHSSRLSRGPDSFTVQSREKTSWWGKQLCAVVAALPLSWGGRLLESNVAAEAEVQNKL